MLAASLLRASLPFLSEHGVALIASSHDVGRPRAGVAAYGASKAALDEILHSWRSEHPELSLIRVGIGPTDASGQAPVLFLDRLVTGGTSDPTATGGYAVTDGA